MWSKIGKIKIKKLGLFQTAVLQHGHVFVCSNHGFIHFSWNSWLQGNLIPFPSSSWQIAHSSFNWTFVICSIFYWGTGFFPSSSVSRNNIPSAGRAIVYRIKIGVSESAPIVSTILVIMLKPLKNGEPKIAVWLILFDEFCVCWG